MLVVCVSLFVGCRVFVWVVEIILVVDEMARPGCLSLFLCFFVCRVFVWVVEIILTVDEMARPDCLSLFLCLGGCDPVDDG